MATRIHVVPDAHGIIHITCDGADLELQIDPPPDAGAPPPPPVQPTKTKASGDDDDTPLGDRVIVAETSLGDKPIMAFRLVRPGIGIGRPFDAFEHDPGSARYLTSRRFDSASSLARHIRQAAGTQSGVVRIDTKSLDVHLFNDLAKTLNEDDSAQPISIVADLQDRLA
jgi:hypothetical protein